MRIHWNHYKTNKLGKRCFKGFCSIFSDKSWQLLLFGSVLGLFISEFYSFLNNDKIITTTKNPQIQNFNNSTDRTKQTLEQKLFNEMKILCLVMTNPDNYQTKVVNILRTWGKRCNKVVLISSKPDKELGIIGVHVGEGKENLWPKSREAFKYIYNQYVNQYDWIFKVSDDNYVIMDNVRLLLYEYDSRTPIYFGFKMSPHVKQGFMSSGGGYVMSNEALKRFVEIALPDKKKCAVRYTEADDAEIGKCLENVGVIAGDSRDINKTGRFFIFPPETHLLIHKIDINYWYWSEMYYKNFEGIDGCSNYTISFNNVGGKITEILDYFVYHVKPYGIVMKPRKLPKKKIYIQRNIFKYIIN